MPRRPLATLPHISCDDACHKRRGSLGGTDYAVVVGTPVYAMFSGMARYRAAGTGGWTITIDRDGNPHRGETMHLSRANGFVLGGASHHVTEGDLIAWSCGRKGAPGSGSASGPHLHAHVYVNGTRYGMEEYLANPQWAGNGTPTSTGKEIIMRAIREPSGGISLVGETTYQSLTLTQWLVESKIWGGYTQLALAEYQRAITDTQVRRAYLLAGISGAGGASVDVVAIAAKVEAQLADHFVRLSDQIAAINTGIGAPTAEEIADAVWVDAADRLKQ